MSSASHNNTPFRQFTFPPSNTPLLPCPLVNTSLALTNTSINISSPFLTTNTSITNKRKLDVPLSFINKRRRIDSINNINTLSSLSSTSTTKSTESMDENSSNISNIKYRYCIDEKVLAWQDRILYKSKIINRKTNINNILYLIHYEGWNNSYNEWVLQDRILPYTPQNIQLMKTNASNKNKKLNAKNNIHSLKQNKNKLNTNNTHLLKQNKNKKSKEVRKKTKIKIASKSNTNIFNNNINANMSNSSLLSSISLNNNYEKRYLELENKCNKYENVIRKLYNECVGGESPRWHLIDTTDKEERVTRDKKLAELRSQIGSLYKKGHWEVTAIGEWKDKPDLQESVTRFVTLNGEYKVNAFAWLNWKTEELKNVLKKYKIENHPHIPALNGQYGVVALMDIPQNTCVGQYFGAEILQSAFDEVYDGTSEEYDHNIYAFDQRIDPEELRKLKQKRKKMKAVRQMKYKNNNNNNFNDICDLEIENIVFIIDPFVGDWKDDELLLRWVNDCRCNIFENVQPTNEDKKYYNVEYVGMKVNGWPQTYLVTKRDIKKGEELMTYYGENFANAIQQQESGIERKKKKQERIDRDIMKELKYELIEK